MTVLYKLKALTAALKIKVEEYRQEQIKRVVEGQNARWELREFFRKRGDNDNE